MQSSSAVAVVTGSNVSVESAVAAGRAYQRCALEAWHCGFAHAVHAGAVQVSHVRRMCRATLLGGREPLLIFRIGKPLESQVLFRPRASRPSLDELILSSALSPLDLPREGTPPWPKVSRA